MSEDDQDRRLKDLESKSSRIGNEVRETASTLKTHIKVEEVFLEQLSKSNAEILTELKSQSTRTDDLIKQCYDDMKASLEKHATLSQVKLECDDVVFLMRKENIECAKELRKEIRTDIDRRLKAAGWVFGLAISIGAALVTSFKYMIEHVK